MTREVWLVEVLAFNAAVAGLMLAGCQRPAAPDESGIKKPSSTAGAASSPATATAKAIPARSAPSASSAASAAGGQGDQWVPSPSPRGDDHHLQADNGDGDGEAAARLKRYWTAMGEGRQASVKKSFSEALEAFDRALAALPDDARAYAERGYAQLLAKNYGLAREDFDRAVLRTTDSKLLAQIWFNYGLTAEQEGRPEDARSAFARSNELNPTRAASAKLQGGSTCTARVSKRQDPQLSSKSVTAPTQDDFLAAFQQLTAGKTPEKVPATADEARLLLCPAGDCVLAPGSGSPIRLKIGNDTLYGAVIALRDSKLRVFPKLGVTTSGACGASDVITVQHQSPFHFRLERGRLVERFDGPASSECTAANTAACTRRCVPGTTIVQDFAFNVGGDDISLLVEQWKTPGGKTPWEVGVSGTDLRILGSGCDIKWELK